MTKSQFRKNAKKVKKGLNKLIDDKIEKFLLSGCVDLKDYENNFKLPKIFMFAMGAEIRSRFRPLGKKDVEIGNNIERFL